MAESHRAEIAKLEALHATRPEGRVFTHLAEAYRKAGEPERAREVLEEGLERHGDYASAHVVLGRVLLDLGQMDRAEASFRRVLGLDGGNLVALRALGELAEQAGRADEAREYFRELLAIDPGDTELAARVDTLAGGGGAALVGPPAPAEAPTEAEDAAASWGSLPMDWDEPIGQGEEAGEGGEAAPMFSLDGFSTLDLSGFGDEAQPSADEPREELEERGMAADDLDAGAELPEAEQAFADWSLPALEPEARPQAEDEGLALPSFDDPDDLEDEFGGAEPGPAQEAFSPEPDRPVGGDYSWSEEEAPPSRSEWTLEPDAVAEEVVTETLAELYRQQGLLQRAAEVYRALLQDRPGDEQLLAKLAEVEGAVAERPPGRDTGAAVEPIGPEPWASAFGGDAFADDVPVDDPSAGGALDEETSAELAFREEPLGEEPLDEEALDEEAFGEEAFGEEAFGEEAFGEEASDAGDAGDVAGDHTPYGADAVAAAADVAPETSAPAAAGPWRADGAPETEADAEVDSPWTDAVIAQETDSPYAWGSGEPEGDAETAGPSITAYFDTLLSWRPNRQPATAAPGDPAPPEPAVDGAVAGDQATGEGAEAKAEAEAEAEAAPGSGEDGEEFGGRDEPAAAAAPPADEGDDPWGGARPASSAGSGAGAEAESEPGPAEAGERLPWEMPWEDPAAAPGPAAEGGDAQRAAASGADVPPAGDPEPGVPPGFDATFDALLQEETPATGGEGAGGSGASGSGAGGSEGDEDDLEMFRAWLQSLKR
jgi:tetratricopeptide (TPR) repeat protein